MKTLKFLILIQTLTSPTRMILTPKLLMKRGKNLLLNLHQNRNITSI